MLAFNSRFRMRMLFGVMSIISSSPMYVTISSNDNFLVGASLMASS